MRPSKKFLLVVYNRWLSKEISDFHVTDDYKKKLEILLITYVFRFRILHFYQNKFTVIFLSGVHVFYWYIIVMAYDMLSFQIHVYDLYYSQSLRWHEILFFLCRSVCDYAKTKFPKNVECQTGHSLAFKSVGRK